MILKGIDYSLTAEPDRAISGYEAPHVGQRPGKYTCHLCIPSLHHSLEQAAVFQRVARKE